MKILEINSSVITDTSVTRAHIEKLIARLDEGNLTVVDRDLTKSIAHVSQELVGSFFTPPADRREAQKDLIKLSDVLRAKARDADAMKAYFDQLARVGVTFKYTDQGPVGLLENKKAYVVVAHLKTFLGFLGITDVHFVDATGLMLVQEAVLSRASQQLEGFFA